MADEIDPRAWTLAVVLALVETPLLDAAEEASGPPRKASDTLRGVLRDIAAWARDPDDVSAARGMSSLLDSARLRYETAARIRRGRDGAGLVEPGDDPWIMALHAALAASHAPRRHATLVWRDAWTLDDRLVYARDAVYRVARLLGYPGRVVTETWREALARAKRELA